MRLDWLKKLFHIGSRPEPMLGAPEGEPEEIVPEYGSPYGVNYQKLSRRTLAAYYDEMYADPLIGPCVDTVVDYATSAVSGYGCLKVSCSDEKLRKTAVVMLQRSGLEAVLPEVARDMLRYGDAFVYIDAGENRIIRLPRPYEIRVNRDPNTGKLLPGGSGARSGQAAYERLNASGEVVSQWGPLDVVHFVRPPMNGSYGTSFLSRLLPDWQNYKNIERSRALESAQPGRLRIHYVPVPLGSPPKEEQKIIARYRKNNARLIKRYNSSTTSIESRKVTDPQNLYIPLYYSRDGTTISGKIEITEVSTVLTKSEMEWWVNKVFSCLRVPPQLLYWDLEQTRFSRGSVSPWEEHWARMIHGLQAQIISGVLAAFLRLIAINGSASNIQDSDLTISMPGIPWRSEVEESRAWMYKSQAVQNLSKAGFNREWLAEEVLGIRDSDLSRAIGGSMEDGQDQD